MGTSERDWVYVGEANVGKEENNRIPIPEGVFEAEILPHPEETDRKIRVYWAYEQVVGFLIISNNRLTEIPDYKPQDSRSLGSSGDGYRVTIPKVFFKKNDPRHSRNMPASNTAKPGTSSITQGW